MLKTSPLPILPRASSFIKKLSVFSFYSSGARYLPKAYLLPLLPRASSFIKKLSVLSFCSSGARYLLKIYPLPILPFPATEEGKVYNLKIIFDGDYLNFYIDDIFVHKFCIMDTETLTNYSSLIVNGECDLAKVS